MRICVRCHKTEGQTPKDLIYILPKVSRLNTFGEMKSSIRNKGNLVLLLDVYPKKILLKTFLYMYLEELI